jgi:hypothetical protein
LRENLATPDAIAELCGDTHDPATHQRRHRHLTIRIRFNHARQA